MSAWAELVNADGSDEWLETCNAALLEVQRETLHRAAEKIRAGAPEAAEGGIFTVPAGRAHGRVVGLLEAADFIDPEVE